MRHPMGNSSSPLRRSNLTETWRCLWWAHEQNLTLKEEVHPRQTDARECSSPTTQSVDTDISLVITVTYGSTYSHRMPAGAAVMTEHSCS